MNHYENSWELYKQHSESFVDDLAYYLDFCRGKRTLEMFAGYGRVANYLVENGVEVDTIELSKDFSSHIRLDASRRHVGDVSKLVLARTFERIVACYNSICLLTSDESLVDFFKNVDAMLEPGGQASLSYYHPNAWTSVTGHTFDFKGQQVSYEPSYDLSQRAQGRGVWIDTYRFGGSESVFRYPVRIVESFADLEPYVRGTQLSLDRIVKDYSNPNISEPGWLDYVFVKRS
jgi:cyclopropane fatty-acyl-phospholipid synthase-like methyltransferase